MGINVAVVGATGLIGECLVRLLEERKFPLEKLFLLASEGSTGGEVQWRGETLRVGNLKHFDFFEVNLVFFCVSAEVAQQFVPRALAKNCWVIDTSTCYRYDDDVPLIVPEVNINRVTRMGDKKIIASPNCSTIQMLVAIKPFYDTMGIERVSVSTYQSVSGAGVNAIEELAKQTTNLLNGLPIVSETFPQQIAFNVLPHIDERESNGYTREEMKMVWETQKILGDSTIKVNPTAARVPVFYGHSESINIETKEKCPMREARRLLKEAPGVLVVDDEVPFTYPTPITHGCDLDAVYIGRLREDISCRCGLNMWVVTDNLRKGGALNAVQIAEEVMYRQYISG